MLCKEYSRCGPIIIKKNSIHFVTTGKNGKHRYRGRCKQDCTGIPGKKAIARSLEFRRTRNIHPLAKLRWNRVCMSDPLFPKGAGLCSVFRGQVALGDRTILVRLAVGRCCLVAAAIADCMAIR